MNLLQTSLDIVNVDSGMAIMIIGLMALLLTAVIMFRNPAGVALWSLTMVIITSSALFGIGLELVWIGIMLTAVITIVGVTAKVVT